MFMFIVKLLYKFLIHYANLKRIMLTNKFMIIIKTTIRYSVAFLIKKDKTS